VRTWLGPEHPAVDEVIAERVRRYRAAVADGSTVPEEVRAAVRYAAERVPVGIVSGAARAEIEPVLARAGLASTITVIIAAEDVEHGKPAPDGYERVRDLLGLEGQDLVVIEDTEAGVASAKAAGLRCLAVLGTLAPDRLWQADESVESVAVPLMERLLS
jgi:HAD superfamily hydrolase (TIGR01509 family)